MIDEIFKAAIFFEKSDALLFAYSGNPRDIVRAVAHKTLQIDELLRGQVVALLHNFDVVEVKFAHSTLVYKHVDMFVDKLEFVLVT